MDFRSIEERYRVKLVFHPGSQVVAVYQPGFSITMIGQVMPAPAGGFMVVAAFEHTRTQTLPGYYADVESAVAGLVEFIEKLPIK